MHPKPQTDSSSYIGSNKLLNKVALITGGDSGIGKAVAIAFAKEGAHLALIYLNEHDDAAETKKYIHDLGGKCLLLPGDIRDEKFCRQAVKKVIDTFGSIKYHI